MTDAAPFRARARTDSRDWLVEADEPLAGLHLRAGGELPGPILAPSLLELVRRARLYGLKLARVIRAQDNHEQITALVEATPDDDGEGCALGIASWQSVLLPGDEGAEAIARRADIARHLAELSAVVGPDQELLSVVSDASDLHAAAERMRAGLGKPWTDFVEMDGSACEQPLHWRLLDGAQLRVAGSDRGWKAHLVPLGMSDPGRTGFELHLVADEPLAEDGDAAAAPAGKSLPGAMIGREIAPVLRQPVARIIANAETIRSQLAGPLAEEYSKYANDIANAGEHLLALIDDLADLEVVEDGQFTTAPDRIDLADVARRAAGILGVRAQKRGIAIDAPKTSETAPAIGEFRRVLQILLNVLGNAIRYSPEGSQVWLRVEDGEGRARLVVADQGEGLSEEQQARVFEKFERLGRSGDGGTGLGLYISRRLARAMGGDLTVESAPGQGARFTLDLPADDRT